VLFNSFTFLLFFVVVTTLYFGLPHRFRWPLLLTASCAFYMSFVPVYILILLATIVIDYFAGILIEGTADVPAKRKYLYVSIGSVCAIFFVFKYFNFFNQNMEALAGLLHWNYPIGALKLILPIGLSFHTFQGLSYVIEVYRGKQKAERHFGIYALYVMYFPQLCAGPIERPQNLIHQFHEGKTFDWKRTRTGLWMMLWGLFKKVVVADSLAIYVDTIYNSATHHTGTSLLVATYFFAIQIYCDFSGYSDMARGISKIYGIELMKNFETPYFSKSIAEFWSRWHISLSTWFKDYMYIPLGGNRGSTLRGFFNLAFVFVVSGFWHGANWTFLVWGGLNGLYLIAERSAELMSAHFASGAPQRVPGSIEKVLRMILTFHLVLFSWIFFRAAHVGTAIEIVRRIAFQHGPLFIAPILLQGFLAIVAVLALDTFHRHTDYPNTMDRYSEWFRVAYSLVLVFAVILFGIDHGTQFIYFQF
jgi:alginate O-acetyltransferase complex protein AlgI